MIIIRRMKALLLNLQRYVCLFFALDFVMSLVSFLKIDLSTKNYTSMWIN